jgi:hypothetical protein
MPCIRNAPRSVIQSVICALQPDEIRQLVIP